MNWRDLENVITRAIQPMKNRLALMIGRTILTAVKDSGDFQTVQLSALMGQSMDNIQRVGEFGFASNPPANSEGIMVALQGNRENCVIIATENNLYRLKNLAPGESAIYNKDGAKWHLKTGQHLEGIVETIKITNSSHEFLQILIDLVTAIIAARTQTAIGPMPLLNVADPFPDIKTRLETFKP